MKQKFKDTVIELKVEDALKAMKVIYLKQYYVDKLLNVDFYLPDSNLVIEADGCFWHGCPTHYPNRMRWHNGKDYARTQTMKTLGYRVLRLWEHDIKTMSQRSIIKKIKSVML